MAYPDYMNLVEAKIIDGVIDRALARGLVISVYDGEEYPIVRSTDKAAIQAETAATDETVYVLRNGTERIGSVTFIHGNGPDVLSDYSWNDKVDGNEAIMAAICNTGDIAL
jgi:hypothetical protein